jgi:hypothetical protein
VIDSIDGKRAKEALDAKRKKRSRKRRQSLITNEMIEKLRKELRLIDKTLTALTKLARLRQQS